MIIFHGNIVYAKHQDELTVHRDSYLVAEDGVVTGIWPVLPEKYAGAEITELGKDVLIPAFSDLHVHAPQYPQRGTAMDELLYDWLNRYTFPLEAKYADPEFAKAVYDAFLADLIRHGTMHAVIFGTIHRETTGYLVERMEEMGLYGYVGKVNMDTDSPEYLCETAEESLRETERFLDDYKDNRRAKPILTPRFAPTCSGELLEGLGKLAKKYHVGLQSHLVESLWEAAEAKRRFPACSCDTEIYEKYGLMDHGPVIGAHFIFPSEEDVRILQKHGGYAVQCPDATVNVIAGIMRTAALADRGVALGIGSDLAGGHCPGIYSQTGRAVQLSKLKAFYEPAGTPETPSMPATFRPEGNRAIPFAQAFYMATKGGGAVFGKVGSLEPGYACDALVIGGLSDPFAELSPEQIVERFCYLGETGNIRARYLGGEQIG